MGQPVAAGVVATSDYLPCFEALAGDIAARGWHCSDNWFRFQPELVTGLHGEVCALDGRRALKPARVGRGQAQVMAPHLRRDRICWLDGGSPSQLALFAQLEALRDYLNQTLYLGLRRYEAQFAIYGPGDFYRRHLDSFSGAASRILSLVLYLNPDWRGPDGGQLCLYPGAGDPDGVCIEPLGGRVAVFLSEEIPHEVLPSARHRYSIACWYRRDGEAGDGRH